MDLSELLNGPIGQNILNKVSSQLGMSESEASSAVKVAVPVILAGLTKNTQSPDGAASLDNALESKHDGSLLTNLAGLLQGSTQELQQDGNGILGHIFGAQKNEVEQHVSQKSGVSMEKICPLLAILAPIVMAYLGKEKRQNNTNAGGLGDLLGGLLGGGKQKSEGGIMGVVTGMLDKNKDGNVFDDLIGMFGK